MDTKKKLLIAGFCDLCSKHHQNKSQHTAIADEREIADFGIPKSENRSF